MDGPKSNIRMMLIKEENITINDQAVGRSENPGCLVKYGGGGIICPPPFDLNRVNIFIKLEYLFIHYDFVNSVSSSGLKVQTVL